MPYRTLDDKIDDLVITFIDITIAKKLELELIKANDAILTKKRWEHSHFHVEEIDITRNSYFLWKKQKPFQTLQNWGKLPRMW